MQVDYRPGLVPSSILLENLTDEELSEATKTYILDRIPDVVHAEIWRDDRIPAEAKNRHERRRDAKMERRNQ